MRTGKLAIEPDSRLVIHSAEMQAHALALHRLRHFKFAPIPSVLHNAIMTEARKFAFRAKRNRDG